MRLLLLTTILFIFSACSAELKPYENRGEYMSSFEKVWEQVKSDAYEKLPQLEVSYFKLSGEKGIEHSAMRTLNEDADLLEPFEKLAHPNGICFKGVWKIDTQNPYGGYFKKGSEALIIARASTAMSNTQRGSTRAFGFAGKLFPTMNPNVVNSEPSANFFLIEDLGGTDAEHFMDVSLTNEPSVSITLEALSNVAYGIKVANAFGEADKNPSIRQLYEISNLGESKSAKIITPKWLKIEAADKKRVDAEDFREELRIESPELLVFNISVASRVENKQKEWLKVGSITFDASVTSASCDRRLHFHHPKWRDDLDYGVSEAE
jgi:hypothetical protein